MSLRWTVWLATLAFLAAACQPPTQLGKQVREPVTIFEQEDFNRQVGLLRSGKSEVALKGLADFVKRYPESRLADDAYYQIGMVQLKYEKYPEAARTFQHIIERFPTSDTILLAKYYFGVAHQKVGDVPSVLPILETVEVRTLPIEFRLSFLTLMREAYRQNENHARLFTINLMIVDLNPADSQTRQEVIAVVEQMTSKEELEAVADQYGDRFPVDYALMKLAHQYLQEGDFERAKDRLTVFLHRFRDAGKPNEFTHDAEAMLERLQRMNQVQARRIGLLLPLSGPYEPVGRRVLNGLLLGSGLFDGDVPPGELGNDVELVVRDTGSEPEKALKALDELVMDEQVVGIIGPLLKKPAAAVAKATGNYGVPTILMSQDEGVLGGSPFTFQNCLLKSDQVRALVRYAVEDLKIRRVAILYPTHSYGQEMFNLLWDELAKHPEVEVRGVESYEKDTNDFGDQVRRLVGLFYSKPRIGELCADKDKQKKRPDCFQREELPPIVDFEALFIPDSAEKIRQIAPTLSYYSVRGVQLFGANLWNTPDLLEKGNADYLQGAIYVDGFFPQSEEVPVQTFINRYRQSYGEFPDILAAQAYDTMMMLRQAAKQSALSSRDELRKYLRGMPTYIGATGKTRFADNGQAIRQLYFFMVDGNKKTRPLALQSDTSTTH